MHPVQTNKTGQNTKMSKKKEGQGKRWRRRKRGREEEKRERGREERGKEEGGKKKERKMEESQATIELLNRQKIRNKACAYGSLFFCLLCPITYNVSGTKATPAGKNEPSDGQRGRIWGYFTFSFCFCF